MTENDFLLKLADATAEPLKSVEKPEEMLMSIIRSNDVVFALWPDEDCPKGWDREIVCGEETLQSLANLPEGSTAQRAINAFWCEGRQQAMEVKREFRSFKPH